MAQARTDNEFDVIIVGGGITGAGTARDCAIRGLKVLLIERQTWLRERPEGITDFCTAGHDMLSRTGNPRRNASRRT